MATKKQVDVTQQKQAKTKKDVEAQDSRTRLWQSLSQTYGANERNIRENYEAASSQLNRQAQARGMGRSSFVLQMDSNNTDRMNREIANNMSNKIADYQNRLGDIERQEADEAWKQKQFDEQVRQFNENQAFQERQNQLAREFQTREREAGQAYNTGEREAQQAYQSAENALARQFQSSERAAQQAYNTSERIATQTYNTSERLGQQAFQSTESATNRAFQTAEREAQQKYNTGEREAQQAFQAGENALNRAQSQSQFEAQHNEGIREFDLNLAYQRERNHVADEQWRRQLEESIRQFNISTANNKDQFAQQLAEQIREFNILHPNNPVSTGGSSPSKNPKPGPGDTNNVSKELQDVMASLGYTVNPNVTKRSNNGNVISGPTNQVIGKTAGAALSPTNHHIYNPSDYTDMGLDRSLPKRK